MARVVHFEIHADDPERAVKFYTNTFNWQIQKWEGPADYWLIKTGDDSERGIDGGLLKRMTAIDGEAVIAYVCTIGVQSLEESLKTVQANGGQNVVPKMGVPGVGWLAYCKDTEGNIFGILQPDPTAQA